LQKARLKQAEYSDIKEIVKQCDVHLERFKIISVGVEVLETAIELIDQFAHAGSLRSLDAVQLASAIFANQMAPIDRFVSSDKNQLAVASQYFPTFNPETDSL
jgi:predicted nucleic acid-binding protein